MKLINGKEYISCNEALVILKTSYSHIYSKKQKLECIMVGHKPYMNKELVLKYADYLKFFCKKYKNVEPIMKIQRYRMIVYEMLPDIFTTNDAKKILAERGFNNGNNVFRVIHYFVVENMVNKLGRAKFKKIKYTSK